MGVQLQRGESYGLPYIALYCSFQSRKRTLDSDDDEHSGDDRLTSKSGSGGGGIYRVGAQKLDFKQYGADYKAKVKGK